MREKDIGPWSNNKRSSLWGFDAPFIGDPNEVRKGLRPHFGDGAYPVNLDGLFDGPELKGDLFVQHTGDDEPEDLVLTLR